MYPVRHISVSIQRSPQEVYLFVSNPLNLPQWAAGLSQSKVFKSGEEWVCDSPMGRVKVKFAEKNSWGVMDHVVTLPSGEANFNPFRVFANDEGSEVIFTLFRLPRMSDLDFEDDAKLIEADLQKLRRILEG